MSDETILLIQNISAEQDQLRKQAARILDQARIKTIYDKFDLQKKVTTIMGQVYHLERQKKFLLGGASTKRHSKKNSHECFHC